MKTQSHFILHSVILVLLLALASYSVGLCASVAYQGVDEFMAMFVAAIAVIVVLPSAFLAWAFRLRQRSRQAGQFVRGRSHIGLYATIMIYCGFWLAVPFDSRWGFSSVLVVSLGALSAIALFVTASSSSFLPRNRTRRTRRDTATATSRRVDKITPYSDLHLRLNARPR
jgi:hypothetical protein